MKLFSYSLFLILLSACGQISIENVKQPVKLPVPMFEVRADQSFAIDSDLEILVQENVLADASDVVVYNGETLIPEEAISLSGNTLVVRNFFHEGENKLDAFFTKTNGEVESLSRILPVGAPTVNDQELSVELDGRLRILNAKLFDIDQSPLKMISMDAHSYFGGFTRLRSAFEISGSDGDRIQSVKIELMTAGWKILEEEVKPALRTKIYKSFKNGATIKVAPLEFMFALPSSKMKFDKKLNQISAKLIAKSEGGEIATYNLGSFQRLVRFAGDSRFGVRDDELGGDDWLAAGMEAKILALSDSTFNDFSNMNGGAFAPHTSHQDGKDVDGWFMGYNTRGKTVATKLMSYLNSPVGKDIQVIFVAYEKTEMNSFWTTIKSAVLNDGRLVRQLIRPDSAHDTHYHVRFF